MDHHRHVDVVPMAAREQLWLAEEELELTLFLAAEALLDIDELLGRDREENDLAGEVIGDADRREAHRRAEHAGDLRVVAAAMRGAGVRVGERVVRGSQAVQFADNGDARTAGFAGDAALDAGERQPGLRREAEAGHVLGDQTCGLVLVEAGLGMVEDRLADRDDLVAVAVDRLAHRLLQFFLARHPPSPKKVAPDDSVVSASEATQSRAPRDGLQRRLPQ